MRSQQEKEKNVALKQTKPSQAEPQKDQEAQLLSLT
jgi:hypothetical protein